MWRIQTGFAKEIGGEVANGDGGRFSVVAGGGLPSFERGGDPREAVEGKSAFELIERSEEGGEAVERIEGNDDARVVRREGAAVVVEALEGGVLCAGIEGFPGDEGDLSVGEGGVELAGFEDLDAAGEGEFVGAEEEWEAIGAADELAGGAEAPGAFERLGGAEGGEVVLRGAFTGGEEDGRIGEAEGGDPFAAVAGAVVGLDLFAGLGGIGDGCEAEDGGEGDAGVFGVEVNLAGEEGFVGHGSATEGRAEGDRAGAEAGFQVESDGFSKENLAGTGLGADVDLGRGR